MKKRIFCLVLCVAMFFASVSVTAFADIGEYEDLTVYTAIGDSIAAGYGLFKTPRETLLQYNYYSAPETSYPSLLGKMMNANITYNMGAEAAWATDYAKMMLDPDYFSPLIALFAMAFDLMEGTPVTAASALKLTEECKYHKLIVDTLKQSDVISIELGGNDILQGLILNELSDITYGEGAGSMSSYNIADFFDENGNFTIDSITVVPDNIRNPLGYCVSLLFSYFILNNFSIDESTLSSGSDVISQFAQDITLENILEIINLFSTDTLTRIMQKYCDAVAESYRTITSLILEGEEITEEEYLKLKATYEKYDELALTASHEKADGQLSEYELLTDGRLDIYEKDGKYFIAPINPDAEIVLVGNYNPYGQYYILTPDDCYELFDFLMQTLKIVSQELLGSIFNFGNSYSFSDPVDIKFVNEFDETLDAANNGSADLSASIGALMESFPSALLYLLVGNRIEGVCDYFNECIRKVAKEFGIIYVGIAYMEPSGEFDVHPKEKGHSYIAQKIFDALSGKTPLNPVAAIKDTNFATLAEAVAAANDGDVIRLLEDCAETVFVNRAVSFTLHDENASFTGTIDAAEGFAKGGFGDFYSFSATENELFPTTLCADELYLEIDGENFGKFTFSPYRSGWAIKDENGLYLSMSGRTLYRSRKPFEWKYFAGSFYCTYYKPAIPSFMWFAGSPAKLYYFYLSNADGQLAVSENYTHSHAAFYTDTPVDAANPWTVNPWYYMPTYASYSFFR